MAANKPPTQRQLAREAAARLTADLRRLNKQYRNGEAQLKAFLRSQVSIRQAMDRKLEELEEMLMRANVAIHQPEESEENAA